MGTLTRTALILATSLALLTGCAATGSDTAGGGDSGAGDGGTGSGEACPVIADYDYFSDSSITRVPEDGQDFGDGTELTFEGPTSISPLYTLYYVDEKGEAIYQSGGAFDPSAPDGTYTTVNELFGSEADGRPGILELETIYENGMQLDNPDPSYVAGTSTVVLGRYCLTLHAS